MGSCVKLVTTLLQTCREQDNKMGNTLIIISGSVEFSGSSFWKFNEKENKKAYVKGNVLI